MNIDNLEIIKKQESNLYSVTDSQGRTFDISSITLEPLSEWFCSYPDIREIQKFIKTDDNLITAMDDITNQTKESQ